MTERRFLIRELYEDSPEWGIGVSRDELVRRLKVAFGADLEFAADTPDDPDWDRYIGILMCRRP